MLILLNKPFQVMPQFTDQAGRKTLADYVPIRGVYPAGRLDYDSEGLIVLTDDGRQQAQISNPRYKLQKTYWVQVERIPSNDALLQLRRGIDLKEGRTRPARAALMDAPEIWPRTPPIRERKSVPTCWLTLILTEGRKRQVRRMTAAVGHPTLRLIRYAVGDWTLDGLQPGEWRDVNA